jgi:probable DNA metabolism protein
MLGLGETILAYDGSFDGFLTAVFEVYELHLDQVSVHRIGSEQESLFGSKKEVVTDAAKADRVWKGIVKKSSSGSESQLYYTFLSEKSGVENLLLRYIRYLFGSDRQIHSDFANADVLKVTQIAKSVGREKHRMEAFVRFRLTRDKLYFASIAPDFNVLPLISKHFINRYADQRWIIYDMKRQYGIFYDLEKVDIIELILPENFDAAQTSPDFFADEELAFQTLWQDYFKSTNIESRKNLRLHVQHVPKRYWKYLSEKQR